MIDPEFCLTMARYNAWQNGHVRAALESLGAAEASKDRKGFFCSLLGTANHLLWGDLVWIGRFDGGARPEGGIKDSPNRHPTVSAWSAERIRTDTRILRWAEGLRSDDLKGDLTYVSGGAGREVSRPYGLAIMHFFNHQTHHRGQIHAMLTAAGVTTAATDLIAMPSDGPWR